MSLLSGQVSKRPRRVEYELMPSDPDEFDTAFFGEPGGGELQPEARDVLSERCTGLISYFAGHDESLYPTLKDLRVVEAQMSPRQLQVYALCRAEEHMAEKRALRRARGRGRNGAAPSGGAFMKTLSRNLCTFVFPEGIDRPRPSKGPRGSARISSGEQNGEGAEGLPDDDYDEKLDAAVAALSALEDETLRRQLPDLSPKFELLVANLRELASSRGGTAIVYSQFRRVEGIGLLALVLDAHGFVELVISPGGGGAQLARRGRVLDDEEARKAVESNAPRYIRYATTSDPSLRSLFNNRPGEAQDSAVESLRRLGLPESNLRGELVLAMLVTKSGAEGISTRNVRQVHLLEPFWHRNMIDQVIGRARRAHSHDDLPSAERDVRPFLYVATVAADQASALPAADSGLTSDQMVLVTADKKHAVLKQLLAIARATAVDCKVDCWKPASSRTHYSPFFKEDLRKNVAATRQGASDSALLELVEIGGTRFWRAPDGRLYDYQIRRLTGKLVERRALASQNPAATKNNKINSTRLPPTAKNEKQSKGGRAKGPPF